MKLYCPECKTRYDGEEYEVCPEDGARLFRVGADSDEGDPLVGAVIDERFRIEDLLGAGGMGAVYRATQLSIQREVALKVLRSELGDEEVALERFYREAKVVSELSHPNIVRLVDFGQDRRRGLLYLVMELVRGRNLNDLVERGRLRLNLALEVIYQVCGALTEPHRRGIVHRDMKPDNIIIVPVSDGTLQVKVLDFGIARVLEEDGTKLTKTGMICGTPWYMSPEQAQNEEVDGRTDIYALGVILFEMLTGQPPFTGETSLQILLNHVQQPAPKLTEVAPKGLVPGGVSDLVARMLEKSREERPESAREVRDQIDALRRELDLGQLRLDPDDDDVFAEWVCPALVVNEGRWSETVDSKEELPQGREVRKTEDVEVARGETEEFVPPEGGDEGGGEKTQREYVAVAETLALHEPVDRPEATGRKTEKVEEEPVDEAAVDEAVLEPAVPLDEESWKRSGDDDPRGVGRPSSLVALFGILAMIVICSGGGVLLYMVALDEGDEEEPRTEASAPADDDASEQSAGEVVVDDEEEGDGDGDEVPADQEEVAAEDVAEEEEEEIAEAAPVEAEEAVGEESGDDGRRDEEDVASGPPEEPPSQEGSVADREPAELERDEAEETTAADSARDETEEASEEPADETQETIDDDDSQDERDELQRRLDELR